MKFEDKLDHVLIIDDEPFQAEWLADYFMARELKVAQSPDLQSALEALETTRYKYVIIDLSIPYSPALAQPLATLGSEFLRYPGLMAARRARSTGHNTYQVIVYSVHDSDDVQSYADRIRCRYILKGRPKELKSVIDGTIDRKPHGWASLRPPRVAEPREKKRLPVRRRTVFRKPAARRRKSPTKVSRRPRRR